MVLMALAAFLLGGYLYFKRPPVVLRDFDAKVVDKSLTTSESLTGSTHVTRLLVEDREGRRFWVGVDAEFYERARVGMWLSRRRGELKLSWEEPAPGPPGAEGARVEAR